MIKIAAHLMILSLFSFHAFGEYSEDGHYGKSSDSSYAYKNLNCRRTHYNYFKASMGSSSVSDYEDFSGELIFDKSSVLPISLAYGVSAMNIGFEAELGFSHHGFEFIPSDLSADEGFGDLVSTKLMLNGLYRTSSSGSHLYFGVGIGLVSVSMDGVEQELSGSSLGAQLIVGGELRTNRVSALFLEYKSLQSLGMELENDFAIIDYDFNESSLNMGFRMYF